MTLGPAVCPSCGTVASVYAVYIRLGDDLVCLSCWGGRDEGWD